MGSGIVQTIGIRQYAVGVRWGGSMGIVQATFRVQTDSPANWSKIRVTTPFTGIPSDCYVRPGLVMPIDHLPDGVQPPDPPVRFSDSATWELMQYAKWWVYPIDNAAEPYGSICKLEINMKKVISQLADPSQDFLIEISCPGTPPSHPQRYNCRYVCEVEGDYFPFGRGPYYYNVDCLDGEDPHQFDAQILAYYSHYYAMSYGWVDLHPTIVGYTLLEQIPLGTEASMSCRIIVDCQGWKKDSNHKKDWAVRDTGSLSNPVAAINYKFKVNAKKGTVYLEGGTVGSLGGGGGGS